MLCFKFSVFLVGFFFFLLLGSLMIASLSLSLSQSNNLHELLSSQKLIVIFKVLVLRILGHRINSEATKICCMYMLVIAKNKIKTNKKLNS